MRTADTGGCVRIPNGHMSLGGEALQIETGGKVWYFSWHHRFGPAAERQDGRGELSKQPAERSPFWDAVHWWHKQGMQVDDSVTPPRAIFKHEVQLAHIIKMVGKHTGVILA